MSANIPEFFGVPERRPVAGSNEAQAGLLPIVNRRLSPSASEARGVNAYQLSTTAVVGGEPLIWGATPACAAVETRPSSAINQSPTLRSANRMPVSKPDVD